MTAPAVLVTGAAGYVGSAVARRFLAEGIPVVAVDDLSTGHRAALPAGVPFVRGSFADPVVLDAACAAASVAGVVHCAALSIVSESVREPARYMKANAEDARAFVERLVARGISRFIFSSSAAVYGEPVRIPIDETHPRAPAHPYGRSKDAFERFLDAVTAEGRLARVSLRYFNAAGAEEGHGEDHRNETHLIPRLLAALRDGLPFTIYGDDYDTPDGTCLRDFVHVADLAEAHIRAWRDISEGRGGVFNLGTGTGHTVREVAEAARRISGRPLAVTVAPRRPGDPARLVASCARARDVLGWSARRDLAAILESAWRWHVERPRGYASGEGS